MPDAFQSAVWGRMAAYVHPNDAALFSFMQQCVQSSRASATFQRYGGTWRRFAEWCTPRGYCSLPARPVTVAMYLAHLMQVALRQGYTYSVIRLASAAIFQAHKLAMLPAVTSHAAVVAVRDCAKRALTSGLQNRKAPLSLEECTATVAHIMARYNPLPNYLLQLAAFIMVCFTGFLRFNDAANIYCDNIKIYTTHMDIFLPTRKNIQAREGHTITIARGTSFACPVHLTELLIATTGRAGQHVPLFQQYNGRTAARHPDHHVAFSGTSWDYQQVRQLTIRALSGALGMTEDYISRRTGLHSLRSGGTTHAAACHVPSRTIQRHGGWRDPRSMEGYIAASLHDKLRATSCMHL
jgi:integrase